MILLPSIRNSTFSLTSLKNVKFPSKNYFLFDLLPTRRYFFAFYSNECAAGDDSSDNSPSPSQATTTTTIIGGKNSKKNIHWNYIRLNSSSSSAHKEIFTNETGRRRKIVGLFCAQTTAAAEIYFFFRWYNQDLL